MKKYIVNNVSDIQIQRKRCVMKCPRENNQKLWHFDTLRYNLKQNFYVKLNSS